MRAIDPMEFSVRCARLPHFFEIHWLRTPRAHNILVCNIPDTTLAIHGVEGRPNTKSRTRGKIELETNRSIVANSSASQ